MHKLLEIKNLNKAFGGIKAVNRCTFDVERGTIVGLIGPNGAGKTTVFNLISSLMEVDSGKILFEGQNIVGMKPHVIFQMGVTRTFQIIRLFDNMTVLENMMIAEKGLNEGFWQALFQPPYMKKEEKQTEGRAMELLKFVDLHVKKHEFAKNLSYGQQKLLEIARSLSSKPELLLLDEPASGVNLTMLKKIKKVIKKLKQQGKTILLVEHNMDFVMDICDKVVVLDHGIVIAEGKPKQIQKNKRVLNAYLGGVPA